VLVFVLGGVIVGGALTVVPASIAKAVVRGAVPEIMLAEPKTLGGDV
jgi:hypothetical protein